MYFESFQTALAMDGHGVFVWTAYAITLAVLVLLVTVPRRREQRVRRQLAARFKRNEPVSGALNRAAAGAHNSPAAGATRESSDASGT